MATLEALVITALLTLGSIGVSGNTGELSTTTGETALIPCNFGEGTIRNLYWYYNDGTGPVKILTLFKGNLSKGAAYTHRASLHDDRSTLILTDIVVKDEGTYRCDVDREQQTAVPNINTRLYVFSLTPDTVPEVSECTEVQPVRRSSACTVHSNMSISVTCVLRRVYPAEDAKLIWYQDGQLVTSANDLMQNDDGTIDMIRPVQVSESGNFTCKASFFTALGAENTTVSVGVTITPEPDINKTPDNNLTKAGIAGITIGVGLAVVLLGAVVYFICRGRRGQEYSSVSGRDEGDQSASQNSDTNGNQNQEGDQSASQNSNTNGKQNQEGDQSASQASNTNGKQNQEGDQSASRNINTNGKQNQEGDQSASQNSNTNGNQNQEGDQSASQASNTKGKQNQEGDQSASQASDTNGKQNQASNPPSLADATGKQEGNVDRLHGRKITDEEIIRLSKELPHENYSQFCVALEIKFNEFKGIITKHQLDYPSAFEEILSKWKARTGGPIVDLDKALVTAEAGGIIALYKNQ